MFKKILLFLALSLLCFCSVAAFCVFAVPLAWTDDRSCVADTAQVQQLASYLSPEQAGQVPPEFYTYFGFRDWWRAPLVYPYSIHAIDGLQDGFLVNEFGLDSYESGAINDLPQLLFGISSLTFDADILLLKRETDFILFDFETEEWQSFSSEEALFRAAQERTYAGSYAWLTLQEYNALFSCSQ